MNNKQIIEQFFVPIKKIQRGDSLPQKPEPVKAKTEVEQPQKSANPKVQEWMRKHAKAR